MVLTVAQIMWCKDATEAIESMPKFPTSMKEFETKCFNDLNKLAAIVRGQLPHLIRAVICALITIDVHARDIITELVEKKVKFLD